MRNGVTELTPPVRWCQCGTPLGSYSEIRNTPLPSSERAERATGDDRREAASAAGFVEFDRSLGKSINAETRIQNESQNTCGQHERAPRGKLAPKFTNRGRLSGV